MYLAHHFCIWMSFNSTPRISQWLFRWIFNFDETFQTQYHMNQHYFPYPALSLSSPAASMLIYAKSCSFQDLFCNCQLLQPLTELQISLEHPNTSGHQFQHPRHIRTVTLHNSNIYYRLYNAKIHYKILINTVKKGIDFEFPSTKFATKDGISVWHATLTRKPTVSHATNRYLCLDTNMFLEYCWCINPPQWCA